MTCRSRPFSTSSVTVCPELFYAAESTRAWLPNPREKLAFTGLNGS